MGGGRGKGTKSENLGVRDGRWLGEKSSPEEMPTLLLSASFAVNPHFLSSDGLEWQFSREARVDNVTAWEAKPAGLASRSMKY